ncbi:hypothetical protein ACFQJ7_17060 [Halovenus rubra]|uniref:Uncharacterized protein n=2 Tax=Halovenus rubra TaxID=869890 RepID=A0ABD5XCX0_9EURY|nr:hypothetical protein [Halovenus rubra]
MTQPNQTYTGDVTLNGDETPPVEVTGPENVYLRHDSIRGDLQITNAEYVYTATPAGETVEITDTNTTITGDIEDGYADPQGVSGDVVVSNAEDVFIEHGAVEGDVQIIGDEQRFTTQSPTQTPSLGRHDTVIQGWKRSQTVPDPDVGVSVVGAQNTVTIPDVENNFELYITGVDNTVRVEGHRITASIHFIGADNTVETSPYVNTTVKTDTGIDNSVNTDTIPVEDLIETSKKEAYSNAFIGRKKIMYQQPAPEQPHCPSCGADADAIIERCREDAWFLFRYPIYHFEADGDVYECDECTTTALNDVLLTEQERKQAFQ